MLACCGDRVIENYLLVVDAFLLADYAAIDIEVFEGWGFLSEDYWDSLALSGCLG